MNKKLKFVLIFFLLLSLTLILSSCNLPFYFSRYNVSGQVTDTNNNPIENVAINFTNGYSSVYTDSNGYWVKTGLGGTVTITAQKFGYTFTPSEYTIQEKETNNLNFKSEEPILYVIEGKVTDTQGNPLSGIRINFSNNSEPAFTGPQGNWSKSGLRGEITVTPEDNNYNFNPEDRTVNGENSYVDFTAVDKDS